MSDPAEARHAMVTRLLAAGTIRSGSVEAAMATVARHRFIDGDVATSYDDVAVIVKRTGDGTAISSASQPTIVAAMLELARLEPGHRVLEIGTGTGYNAALLASIVCREGTVVSVELDEDLADRARQRLQVEGFASVRVLVGDGAAGHPDGAPFDRIVVTTGAPTVAEAWYDQLVPGGRLIVPIVGTDGIGSLLGLVKRDNGFEEIARLPCGFLPMRGQS